MGESIFLSISKLSIALLICKTLEKIIVIVADSSITLQTLRDCGS
jgi:hypothetical protein